MLYVVSLSCTNCGASLTVDQNMNRFACGYCGAQLVVERSGGTVCLKLVEETLKSIRTGTDKTAAELAIRRLQDELRPLLGAHNNSKSLVYSGENDVLAEKQATAKLEAASQTASNLRANLESERSKARAASIGLWSSILWGPLLPAVFSVVIGGVGPLLGIIVWLVLGLYLWSKTRTSRLIDLEHAVGGAEVHERAASEEARQASVYAKRSAERRAELLARMAELEPQIQEIQRRIEENQRIANS